jgi:hypothetical protein
LETFINIEDHGEWLNFRVQIDGQTVPVRITKEAIDDHFGVCGDEPLAQSYARHSEEINAIAISKVTQGSVYTREHPLILRTADL